MKNTNNDGFAHSIVLIGLVSILLIGGAYVAVLRANHNKNAKSKSELTSSKGSSASTKSSDAETLQGVAVVQTGTTPSSSSSKSATKSSNKTSTTTSNVNTGSATQSTSSTPSTPAQTPLSALTAVISLLKSGGSANVTAGDVDVPAAVSGNVKARPIVFTVNGTTYLAYTRVNPPDFSSTSETTANTMAIVQASGSTTLVQAHLDKSDNLVDPDFKLVGYTPSNS